LKLPTRMPRPIVRTSLPERACRVEQDERRKTMVKIKEKNRAAIRLRKRLRKLGKLN
jgi:hypothetical protein